VKVWIKTRYIRSRIYGNPHTFHGELTTRVSNGVWKTVGITRGHLTSPAAEEAARRLAVRKGYEVEPESGNVIQRLERYADLERKAATPCCPTCGQRLPVAGDTTR